jgi:O-antigen ligase
MIRSSRFYFSLYMALLGGNWIVYHTVLPVRIAHHLLLTGFLVWWLIKRGLPDTPVLLSILAMGASVALSGFGAIDRRMALEFAWHWLTNWLLFLFLIDDLRRHSAADWFYGQFAAGAILAVSCILEWLLVGGRPAGLFGVINLTGAYLAALVVPALGWAITSRNVAYYQIIGSDWVVRKYTHQRNMFIGFILLVGIVLILNQSRGPVLSVIVALVAFAFLTIKGHTVFKIVSGVLLMGLCAVLLVSQSQEAQHSNGDPIRMDLWEAGEDMLMDNPTGVGVGLFAQAYHLRTIGDGEDRFTGAHNYYINLGAELGAPGLAAGAAFLLVGLYFLIEGQRTIQQNAVLASLIGVLAHMAFDNYPAQNWSFLLSLYAAYLLYEARIFNAKIPGMFNRLLIYGLMVYALLFGMWDIAQIHYEKALQLKDIEEAQTALAIDPHNRLYKLELERLGGEPLQIKLTSNFTLTNYARISY